jgi:hypothetical protein
VLFSTHIVSDLERVASRGLPARRLLLNTALDDLRDCHARLLLPAPLAAQAQAPLAGELRRRTRPDGSLHITLARAPGADWPALA